MSLQTARICSRKAALNEDFSGGKNKFYALSVVVKDAISNLDIGASSDDIIRAVDNAIAKVKDEYFSHDFEFEANRKNIIECLIRYFNWEYFEQGSKFVKKNITGEVKIPSTGKIVTVTADALIDRGDCYHLIRYFRGKPTMSYGGRLIETNPSENADLFLLQLLGDTFTLDKPVYPAFYYLKGKSEKSGYFALDFEPRRGENIICYRFSSKEAAKMLEDLKHVRFDINDRAEGTTCNNCTYVDLCNTEFVPRELPKPREEEDKAVKQVKVTKEQERLITAREGYYCVNAVAGSGKTSVIALRTLSLLEEDEDPEKVLMITFTNKAKEEMFNKIKEFEKAFFDGWGLDVSKINIETFNSWGQKIINAHYDKIGFTGPPEIIDDLTKRDIIITLLEKYNSFPVNYEYPFMDLPYAKGAVIEMALVIDKLKAERAGEGNDVKEILDGKWMEHYGSVMDFYKEYNAELKKRNKLDYEDQLRLLSELKPYKIFETLPYVHFIIDEFQDSNPNQLDIIEELIRVNKNIKSLVVVGDTMQSIYGFRNTSPENLMNFGSRFQGTVNIDLTKNFRSDKGIVDWANIIIGNESKTPKYMKAHNPKSYEPVLKIFEKDAGAEKIVLAQVEEWVSKGVPLSDIALLGRSKNELVKYQGILVDNGYNAVLQVPEIIKDNPYVKSVFALARYLLNSDDVKDLAFFAKSKGINCFDRYKVLTLGENLKDAILSKDDEAEKITMFFKVIEDTANSDYTAKAFIDKLTALNAKTLEELLIYIKKYDMYEVKDTFNVPAEDTNAITLITVHSAKGLEYPNVILMIDKFKDNEEERRLLYVGITRARSELLVVAKKNQYTLTNLLTKCVLGYPF